MTQKLQPGFYWARRKDDGELTVIEVWQDGETLHLLGNLNCPDLVEAAEYFDILSRIPEPQ